MDQPAPPSAETTETLRRRALAAIRATGCLAAELDLLTLLERLAPSTEA